ncbi:MAG: alginate lyase family protein [Pyrinomonadaceae bacterium]
MTIGRKIKHAFRGQVSPRAALFEIGRRGSVALRRRYEKITHSFEDHLDLAASLHPEFARLAPSELLSHFQNRCRPEFFAGLSSRSQTLSSLQQKYFAAETATLIERARRIVDGHRWTILGYGELVFGPKIDWLRDPVSRSNWPLNYSLDIAHTRADGGDVRVLWELNRLGHLVTLSRAYAVSGDERFAEEFFVQVESWKTQNKFGFGPNWSCAMEVALRAMNLLTAFQLFRFSSQFTEERLKMMITLFAQHGEFISHHLEFSYIATSNHYLSDVVGLFWIGICFPELEQAAEWRKFGLQETLREMDKQVLSDGADYESSTGYHRFVLELFLYSFLLCRANSVEIEDRYWQKLRSMLDYVRAYLRPDGQAPLVGDSDSGQVVPLVRHDAGDHGYLLGIGAALFNEPNFKIEEKPVEEILWLLGEDALETFTQLETLGSHTAKSTAFAEAGTYVLRDKDLYLLFNTSGAGLTGRGSHGHNDALSIEVAAGGTNFLSDPGTYVYTSDLVRRHQFRSTAYHSTVEVDNQEQNTTEEATPFRIGNEAQPRVLHWETGPERDLVIAEHSGYKRLANGPVTHRRLIKFEKSKRYWMIEDTLAGSGTHEFKFIFHFAPNLETAENQHGFAEARDSRTGARLLILSPDLNEQADVEARCFSRDYGAKRQSLAACWKVQAAVPLTVRWFLLPISPEEDDDSRRRLITELRTAPIGIPGSEI